MPECKCCGSSYSIGQKMCYYCSAMLEEEQASAPQEKNGRYIISCPLCAMTYEVDFADSKIHECECGFDLSEITPSWVEYEVVKKNKNTMTLVRRADKKEYTISDDKPIIIGRCGDEAFLDIFADDYCSRHECEISFTNGRWQIAALNTHGHILINGNEIPLDGRKRLLKNGDILTVYNRRFNVVI